MNIALFVTASVALLGLCLVVLVRPLWKQARVLAAVLLGVFPLLSVALYLTSGNLQVVTQPWRAEPINQQSLERSIAVGRQKLAKDPNNAELMLALAQGEMLLGDYTAAGELYTNARQQLGDIPRVVVPLADALAMQNQGRIPPAATTMLEALIARDPLQSKALWLLALAAEQRHNPAAALGYWRRILPLVESEDAELAGQVRAQITRLDVPDFALHIAINLSPALEYAPAATDLLFVTLQQPNGGIPLAAQRLERFAFPLNISLGNLNAINPQHLPGNQPALRVRARISTHGQAAPLPGDLYGQLSWQAGQPASVQLIIDSLVPGDAVPGL